MEKRGTKQSVKEPSIVVKPIGRFGGLDTIHVALIVLVVILIALVAVLAYSKPAVITGNTNSTNSIGLNPTHNASQIKLVAEKFIAAYRNFNSSLSLLPFYANVSRMSTAYSPQSGYWYVTVPFVDPFTNQNIYFSMYISDSNTSKITSYIQTSQPASYSNYFVASSGVIQMPGRAACTTTNPVQIYWFLDPYAPGAVQTLANATALQIRLGSSINLSVEVLFTSYTQSIGSSQGLANARSLGQYIFCASKQPEFSGFVANLNSRYTGTYLPPSTLNSIAASSNLNMSSLNACISNSTAPLNAQQLFGSFYNITTTPEVVTNCEYLSIPQTTREALCYTNNSLC